MHTLVQYRNLKTLQSDIGLLKLQHVQCMLASIPVCGKFISSNGITVYNIPTLVSDTDVCVSYIYCWNDWPCVDIVNGYTCACGAGYMGRVCEIGIVNYQHICVELVTRNAMI